MTVQNELGTDTSSGRVSPFYDPRIRGIVFQAALIIFVVVLVYIGASNAIENLQSQNIASGFGFLGNTAGFAISQTLIPYSVTSTYGDAFVVGLLNTLLVAAIGIVLATILGFIIGIARLSSNWLVAKVATAYVEIVRNLPLLLQLLFWYFAVVKSLPSPRESYGPLAGIYLNIRGLFMPRPVFRAGQLAVRRRDRRRRDRRHRCDLALGEPAPGGDGAAVPDPVDEPRAVLRSAAVRARRHRLPGHLRHAGAQGLQLHRRHADGAGVRGALARGSSSTRPRSSPRSSGPASRRSANGQDRGGRCPRASGAARRSASSSSRRRCG